MRIIGGTAGGRRLKVPATGTRPTSDRVREALFNSLEHRMDIDGARVLDLYAGSGAFALECLSRGAQRAMCVDADRKACRVIAENSSATGLLVTVEHAPVARVLGGLASGESDLVFLDPPYDLADDAVTADLTALRSRGWLADGALVIVERSTRSPLTAWPEGFDTTDTRSYGETRVELATYVPAVTV